MKNWQKRFPPYEDTEPYLYFAFAEADAGKAWKIMCILLRRGCRVWYPRGLSGSAEELLRRQDRAAGAALTVLFLTDSACSDPDTKSRILVNQKLGQPILCLDPDSKDRRLAMGLKEEIPHIPLYPRWNSTRIEDAIIHSDSFSQDILDRPVDIRESSLPKALSALFSVLALILAAAAFAGIRYLHWSAPQAQEDPVPFSDPVLLSAVRREAGEGPITEDLLSRIRFLRLESIPGSWDELVLLPALERIELPQQALIGDAPLPDGNYIIELGGGLDG